MDKFEEFIIKKYPNRSPKVLLQKFQDADGTWFYGVKEVQDQSEAWQARQAEIDRLKEAIEHQGKLAIQAMNEAHKGSRLELSIAEDIQANLKPELIESERQMNAQLTEENMKLETELDEKDKRIEAAMSLIQAWNDQGYRDDAEQLINVDLVEALRGDNA